MRASAWNMGADSDPTCGIISATPPPPPPRETGICQPVCAAMQVTCPFGFWGVRGHWHIETFKSTVRFCVWQCCLKPRRFLVLSFLRDCDPPAWPSNQVVYSRESGRTASRTRGLLERCRGTRWRCRCRRWAWAPAAGATRSSCT